MITILSNLVICSFYYSNLIVISYPLSPLDPAVVIYFSPCHFHLQVYQFHIILQMFHNSCHISTLVYSLFDNVYNHLPGGNGRNEKRDDKSKNRKEISSPNMAAVVRILLRHRHYTALSSPPYPSYHMRTRTSAHRHTFLSTEHES